MRRMGLMLLAGLLCLALGATALASGALVLRAETLAAFVDGDGGLYLSGMAEPINTLRADSVLYLDEERCIFLSGEGQGSAARLVELELNHFSESVLSEDVRAACYGFGRVYYASFADATLLMGMELGSANGSLIAVTQEGIQNLTARQKGIVIACENGTSLLYSVERGSLTSYEGAMPASISLDESGEASLSDTGTLKFEHSSGSMIVANGAADFVRKGDVLYYTLVSRDTLLVKAYSIESRSERTLLELDAAQVLPQLSATDEALLLLGADNLIYAIRMDDGAIAPLYEIGNLADGYDELRLEGMRGQVNLYGRDDAGALRLIKRYMDDEGADDAYSIEETATPEPTIEPTIEPTAEPTAEPTIEATATPEVTRAPEATKSTSKKSYAMLRLGSRGARVVQLQEKLIELGYLAEGENDGIYGARTREAVMLLQQDRGVKANGKASASLQRQLFNGEIPAFNPAIPLQPGKRSLRVRKLQERLRALGYTADGVDGIYGARTEGALKLFQSTSQINDSGIADEMTLKMLFASDAPAYNKYISLQKGDHGELVRALNLRLEELYFLDSSSVGSRYSQSVVLAVKRFQKQNGLKQDGIASPELQELLFSNEASQFRGYISLLRGDENERVARLQGRLKDLGYFPGSITGFYGSITEQAIRGYQRITKLPVTGIADPHTQICMFPRSNPIFAEGD